MKQVLFLLIFILWAVLQARRKAMREQARKQAIGRTSQEQTPSERKAPLREQPVRQVQSTPLGAVTAEENQPPVPRWVERLQTALAENEISGQTQSSSKTYQKVNEKKTEDSQAETVEEIVTPASESAYETSGVTKQRIPLTPESLRTFIVTREILGPARSRNPHRPGMRGK